MAVQLSGVDVARAAYEAGFRGEALTTAVAVAKAESGWRRDIVSSTQDYGLWQIHKPAHPSYDYNRLLSEAVYNATAAYNISSKGTNWRPWYAHTPLGKSYGTGPYRNYLNDSVAAVNMLLSGAFQPGTVGGAIGSHSLFGSLASTLTNTPAPAPAPSAWRPAMIRIDSRERQLEFDIRHRRVGTRLGLHDSFMGPTYQGVIWPIHQSGKPTAGQQPAYGSQRGVRGEGHSPAGAMGVGVPGGTQALFFEFNPNEIAFNYNMNPEVLPMDALDPSQIPNDLPMSDKNTTISFSLWFDRTYEVMDGSNVGVLTDVRQLERLCGITPERPIMLPAPVNIHFAAPVSFHFKAIISSIAVNYIHFSHGMIPMRCTVAVTAYRLSSTNPFAPVHGEESAATAAGGSAKDYSMPSSGGANKTGESISSLGPAA